MRPRRNTVETILEHVFICEYSNCWLWQGYVQHGYGRVGFKGKNSRVHKVVYTCLIGEVKSGFDLHHRCQNKHCCNPEHLMPLPRGEHSKLSPAIGVSGLAAVKARSRTHCKYGHEFTDANTNLYAYKNKIGRRCRKCAVIRNTAYRHNKKAEGDGNCQHV